LGRALLCDDADSLEFAVRVVAFHRHGCAPEVFMKIILTGLHEDADIEKLRERMSHFGPVIDIQAVRDGDPDKPWFIVDMDVDVGEATNVARRIDGIYYNDRFLHARVMFHG